MASIPAKACMVRAKSAIKVSAKIPHRRYPVRYYNVWGRAPIRHPVSCFYSGLPPQALCIKVLDVV
jgi:hypothetical protein